MNYEQKHPILQKLEEYFKNTPKEQINKDWSGILKDTDSEAYYEKKYNDALERARKVYIPIENNILDDIFPELSESEDKNIRKAIHIYLDWLDGRKDYAPKGDYTIRDMIAWLEKQGNTNETSAKWSEEDKQMILCIEQIMNCASLLNIVPEKIDNIKSWLKSLRPQKQWKPSTAHKREIDDAYLQGICDAKHEIEKQGEQLDPDKVIAWLVANICDYDYYVKLFKKDFDL